MFFPENPSPTSNSRIPSLVNTIALKRRIFRKWLSPPNQVSQSQVRVSVDVSESFHFFCKAGSSHALKCFLEIIWSFTLLLLYKRNDWITNSAADGYSFSGKFPARYHSLSMMTICDRKPRSGLPTLLHGVMGCVLFFRLFRNYSNYVCFSKDLTNLDPHTNCGITQAVSVYFVACIGKWVDSRRIAFRINEKVISITESDSISD